MAAALAGQDVFQRTMLDSHRRSLAAARVSPGHRKWDPDLLVIKLRLLVLKCYQIYVLSKQRKGFLFLHTLVFWVYYHVTFFQAVSCFVVF